METVCSIHNRTDIYELSEPVVACTGLTQVPAA